MKAEHPGKHLAEVLAELGISQRQLARAVGISPMRISHVVNGARPVTPELALRLSAALGQAPEHWLSLQAAHDLAIERSAIGRQLRRIRPVAGTSSKADGNEIKR